MMSKFLWGLAVGSWILVAVNSFANIVLPKSTWECTMRDVRNDQCTAYERKDTK